MNNLRIVYMGTPEFAVAGLSALVEGGYNVVAVVTGPDKPVGRGHHVAFTPVKEYALAHHLPVLQPEKLKDEQFVEQLRGYHADLQIVVAFRMLPEVVWSMPRLGTFNVHGSLLPQYRGAAPIHWAVIHGDTETGLTTFMLKHEIDTGNIILQEKTPIGEDEDTGSVHDRLMEMSRSMVIRTTDLINRCDEQGIPVPTTPQPEVEALRAAPKLFKDNTQISSDMTAGEMTNFVRGLSPFPAAWTNLTIRGKVYDNVKVYRVRPLSSTADPHDPNKIMIPCKDGMVEVLSLQIPGKKRMDAKSLLNGLH